MRLLAKIYYRIVDLAKEWQVNPLIYGVIYVVTSPLWVWGVYDCVCHKSLTFWGIIAISIGYILRYVYVFVFGKLPTLLAIYLWAALGLAMIALGAKIGFTGAVIVLTITIVTLVVAKFVHEYTCKACADTK